MTLKIGHRGASGIEPENTLRSFRRALALGADAVECDVHLCKSGEAVVIHDATLRRTTNGRGRVAGRTLAELRALDAGRGETIPTLEELIEAMNGRATIFIEVKAPRAAEAVADIVGRYAVRPHIGYARLPIISFKFALMADLKRRYPPLLTGVSPPQGRIPDNFARRAQAAGMWSINPCIDRLESSLVDDAHVRGLKVITWTANSAAQIARARTLGVDGIMSDYPDRL